jgi:hypothetical protein
MRLPSANLPLPLLKARRDGRLVVFAGAGTSRPEPSNLPDFEALVKTIAAGTALEQKKDEPPDRFLGRLKQAGVPVHERAARILSAPNSRPNEVHRLLVKLFPSPAAFRIVTTNFDHHFETEIAAQQPDWRIEAYVAPRLPVGGRFAGLAYVHGRLGEEPTDLVLTDGDFGRAYLTEGWASRFLIDLFATYDVLFVGYSHRDALVSYLARGLPPTENQKRFALTERGESDWWQLLGVSPIEYEDADDHVALRGALREWLELEGRGPLGHERKVRELLERSPEALTEQDEDYLLELCLPDPRLAQFFYRHADDPAWLGWTAKRSVLSPLFACGGGVEEEQLRIAAEWFTRKAIGPRGEVARELAQKERHLSGPLWLSIASAVWRELDQADLPTEAAERAAQWLTLLERHDEAGSDHEYIDYWLGHLSAERHTFLAVQVFAFLTRPLGVSEPGLRTGADGGLVRGLRQTVRIRGDRHWLMTAWQSLFAPHLDVFAGHLAPLVFAHLQQAHLILRSQGVATDDWDPLSYARAAIEPHEQNEHGSQDAFNVLIDAARDILDWLILKEPDLARFYIETGLVAASPLMRRVCIYGLAKHPTIAASRKLNWVVNERWLEQWLLWHETLQLLHAAYKESSMSARRRLITAAKRALPARKSTIGDPAEEPKPYELFNLLTWLEGSEPACPLVAESLGKIRRQHPDLAVRPHPDFSHWSEGVHSIRTVSPTPLAEILKLEPAQWVAEYVRIGAMERDPGESPRIGFLEETEKAAAQDLDWGLRLAERLALEGLWDHEAWHFLLRCWAGLPLDERQWNQVLAFLGGHREIWRQAADVADVLQRRMEQRDLPATQPMIDQALALAGNLWATLGREPEETEKGVGDWVQFGINRAGGKLGMFAVHALSRLLGIQEENRGGIPAQFRPLLEGMAEVSEEGSTLGRVMLCGYLHFWFAIDAEWTTRNLFPLFEWSRDRLAAEQAWHGFLSWGRPARELMAVFMPYVTQTFDHLADLGRVRGRLSEYLAWTAYGSVQNPLEAGWVEEYLRKAAPEDRKEWTCTIGSLLSGLGEEERHQQWDTWLRRYLELRLESVVPIGDEEWACVIKWSLELADVLPEVVALVSRHPASRAGGDIRYYQLQKREQLLRHPEALIQLLDYLLAAETRLFVQDCKYIEEMVVKLLAAGGSRDRLRVLVERLADLGCPNAQELAALIEGTDGPS